MKETQPVKSATRSAAVIFGVHLSAQSRLTVTDLARGGTIQSACNLPGSRSL